jgi:chemotaxis protein methyltransferase CheR
MSELIDPAPREFSFTNEDFNFLSKLVGMNTGINLTEDKRELVYGRVAKRLRLLGLHSFSDYCMLLQQGNTEEVTTNVTSFFREAHHFEYLASTVIPDIISKNAGKDRPQLRIWSAGCSSGEEPYSIAMVLRESISDIDKWDARILATDLDSNVLETAKIGEYPIERANPVSNERKKRWLLIGTGSKHGRIKIRTDIRDMVHFKQLNLAREWPVSGMFDCIFFRNVAIYFKRDTQIQILNRFADHLEDNGTLFVGHAESLAGVCDRFVKTGHTIHQKAP